MKKHLLPSGLSLFSLFFLGSHLALPQPARAADTCRLTIELFDKNSGATLPGVIRAPSGDATEAYASFPELLNRLAGLPSKAQNAGWHSLPERATITVPQANLRFEAFHGIETELASVRIDLTGKDDATLRIPLTRFYDARDRGRVSANTHLHLKDMTREEADRYLLTIPKADSLDLVFLSYLERAIVDRTYISNLYTRDDLEKLSKEDLLFGNGEEHRHNFGPGDEGFGHVMLLNIDELIHPVSIGPGITEKGTDGIPLQRGIRTARDDGATIVWCHNLFGLEDIPNWLGGYLDAQNIFDGGTRGSYEDTYYRYLNVGLRVPFSTGTDWFLYDFSRVYVPLEEPLTVDRWLDALAAGKSFITNGAILEFNAGSTEAGGAVSLKSPGKIPVRGRALARADFEKLQLIRNGEIIHTVPSRETGGHFEAELSLDIAFEEPGWLALRIETENMNELGRALFAHTSPVYVEIAGRSVFLPGVARELIAETQAAVETIEATATFGDDAERESVLNVYREGIRELQQRLREHNQ